MLNTKVIAFVACSKKKTSYKTKARELYQGPLFKKALRYAEQHYLQVYILSAKYGIVDLEEVIAPYDKTLKTMLPKEKTQWADMVKKQMEEKEIYPPFIFFTGVEYHKYFEGEKPLLGLSLGYSLQWFSKRLQKKGFFE